MAVEQKASDLHLGYRLGGKLTPLKNNLENHIDDDNASVVITAFHSDLDWGLVPTSFLRAQPLSSHWLSTVDHHKRLYPLFRDKGPSPTSEVSK